MLGFVSRLVFGTLRLLVFVLVFALLASAAVTLGVVDIGLEHGEQIETPDPLPDWPFVWELPVPLDEPIELDQHPDTGPSDDTDYGDPIRTDPGTTTVETSEGTITTDELEARVHERINDIRTAEGLSPLEADDESASIARTYSHDMSERGYFSHVSPEGEGPDDRFGDRYPGQCRAVGENLAVVGTQQADDADAIVDRIVDGWMNSEGHRENILTERWDTQGIGIYSGDAVYATQKFCDSR